MRISSGKPAIQHSLPITQHETACSLHCQAFKPPATHRVPVPFRDFKGDAQVIAPRVKAYLYTWGEPRFTAEGDRIPAKTESLDIGYIDGMLLLPLVEEHNIDERSPLCGHTHESLMAVSVASGDATVQTADCLLATVLSCISSMTTTQDCCCCLQMDTLSNWY